MDRDIRNTRIGISYHVLRNLNLCLDYEYFNIPGKKLFLLKGQYHKIHFGGEYKLLDKVTLRAGLDHKRLAVLFPETPRQGAEVATRRLAELVREQMSEVTGKQFNKTVPVEIASYPDTGGTKTLDEFLKEFAERTQV